MTGDRFRRLAIEREAGFAALADWKYRILFTALILLALLPAILPRPWFGGHVLDATYLLVVLSAVYATCQRRRQFLVAVVLAVPSLLTTSADIVTPIEKARPTMLVCNAVFAAFALAVLFGDLFDDRPVTIDRLFGAVAAYLLLGIVWAFLFSLVAWFDPRAFRLSDVVENRTVSEVTSELLYYSFVTISTLGYGDVQPVSRAARTLSWLEAVLGQMYVAIVVARFVALHLGERIEGDARRESSSGREPARGPSGPQGDDHAGTG